MTTNLLWYNVIKVYLGYLGLDSPKAMTPRREHATLNIHHGNGREFDCGQGVLLQCLPILMA